MGSKIEGESNKQQIYRIHVTGTSIYLHLVDVGKFILSMDPMRMVIVRDFSLSSKSQWLFLVPLKGGRSHITPQKAIYKWYISGIYCQLGDYMPPTTRNNH